MNWDQRIAKAEKNGHFTERDKSISGNWTKCSVGERFEITSINDAQLYIEPKTLKLGIKFCERVCQNEIKLAKRLHNKIKKMAV